MSGRSRKRGAAAARRHEGHSPGTRAVSHRGGKVLLRSDLRRHPAFCARHPAGAPRGGIAWYRHRPASSRGGAYRTAWRRKRDGHAGQTGSPQGRRQRGSFNVTACAVIPGRSGGPDPASTNTGPAGEFETRVPGFRVRGPQPVPDPIRERAREDRRPGTTASPSNRITLKPGHHRAGIALDPPRRASYIPRLHGWPQDATWTQPAPMKMARAPARGRIHRAGRVSCPARVRGRASACPPRWFRIGSVADW